MERALEARCSTAVTLDQLVATLGDQPAAVLATVDEADVPAGLFVTELAVSVGESSPLHQQVVVDLGPAQAGPGEVRWPISWHPVTHERVLPSFSGVLVARSAPGGTEVALEGSYRPPLGRVGKFGDGVIGHRVARRTAAAFVGDVVERVSAACARSTRPAGAEAGT